MGARLVISAAIAIAWIGSPAVAHAQFGNAKGGASLHLDTRYGQVEDAAGGDRDHQAGVALQLRAMAGLGPPLLYAAGLDYQLGGRTSGAFQYEVDLYPIGFGFLITHDIMIGARGGIGVSGVTGEVPFTVQLPVELMLELDLHRRVRVAAWARPSWVFADARADGAEHLGWADELSGAVALRFGRRYYPHDSRFSAGNGYYLAATYQEQLGGRIIGGAFGFSLNVGGGKL